MHASSTAAVCATLTGVSPRCCCVRCAAAAEDIREEFPSSTYPTVHVVESADAETTGNFDVIVNGVLVHSKKRGDGFLDDDEKLDRVFDAINAALNSDPAYAPGAGADEETAAAGDKLEATSTRKSLNTHSSDSPLLGGKALDANEDKAQRRSLIVSICTLLISIPALIGA